MQTTIDILSVMAKQSGKTGRPAPTKDDIVAALRDLGDKSSDGRVSKRVFREETGWSEHYFYRLWPDSGFRGACEEAGVLTGLRIAVDTNTRLSDEDLARRLAGVVATRTKLPPQSRLFVLMKTYHTTFKRGEPYDKAKARIINAYFALPISERSENGDAVLRRELESIAARKGTPLEPQGSDGHDLRTDAEIPKEYLRDVEAMRGRGEEEQRQLVVRLFSEILGYRRTSIRSEHERNDVCVLDRNDAPWLVAEVKGSLETEAEIRRARRQGFDYAHRHGARYVVLSDGDYYEIYDRTIGTRLLYREMRMGNFRLTAFKLRDRDLLATLASGA